MKDGGRLIPESMYELLEGEVIVRASPYGRPYSLTSLTRRQRLRLRWMELRWRVVTAAEVLAGKHECYDPYD